MISFFKPAFLIIALCSFNITPNFGDPCNMRNTAFKADEEIKMKVFYNTLGMYVGAGEAVFTSSLERYNGKAVYHLVGTGRAVSLWAEIATRTKVTRLPNQTCNNLEEIQVPIANIHGGLWHTKYTRSGAVVDHIARKIGEWHQQLSTRDAAQQTVAADAVTRRG